MTFLKADCPACGTVVITVDELGCAIHPARVEALCQFECPACALTVTQGLPPHEVVMLRALGAPDLGGRVPFELVEDHFGPPLSLDDLLDFHEEISNGTGVELI
ncbi:MAG: hypothetical protein M3198_12705 [Actinomycetota bacterium]|nr:hypothetical protein [Actinomycetota bacterium]